MKWKNCVVVVVVHLFRCLGKHISLFIYCEQNNSLYTKCADLQIFRFLFLQMIDHLYTVVLRCIGRIVTLSSLSIARRQSEQRHERRHYILVGVYKLMNYGMCSGINLLFSLDTSGFLELLAPNEVQWAIRIDSSFVKIRARRLRVSLSKTLSGFQDFSFI